MRRRRFVAVLCGAASGICLGRAGAASAQPLNLGIPLRVRLLAGVEVVKVSVNGAVVDAVSGTLSTGSSSTPFRSGVAEFSGSPYLNVVALTKGGASVERRYPGTLFVQPRRSELIVINEVDVESYVASVMSAEVSPGWATESLRAQAIAVRTYAARSRLHRAGEYDLGDGTASQVYPGIAEIAPSFVSAAQDTAGQVVAFASAPASVFYGSSCGGHTAASEELTGQPSPSYLFGIADLDRGGRAYCSAAPYFRWRNSVAKAAMARVVAIPAEQLEAVSIVERWPDGRARTISAKGSGSSVTLSGREFYQRALAMLGYKVIPSALFDVTLDGDDFALVGHGVGHGVGMCQWGARGRADAGQTAGQILQAYFPGTSITRV